MVALFPYPQSQIIIIRKRQRSLATLLMSLPCLYLFLLTSPFCPPCPTGEHNHFRTEKPVTENSFTNDAGVSWANPHQPLIIATALLKRLGDFNVFGEEFPCCRKCVSVLPVSHLLDFSLMLSKHMAGICLWVSMCHCVKYLWNVLLTKIFANQHRLCLFYGTVTLSQVVGISTILP